MVIRTNSSEHEIVKRLRDHDQRLDDAEQDRESDPSSQVIRRVSETALSDDEVEVTPDDEPYLVYDDLDSGWDRSSFQT